MQILCKLIKPFKVLLLDEITTDLDLLARHDLLTFLREESEAQSHPKVGTDAFESAVMSAFLNPSQTVKDHMFPLLSRFENRFVVGVAIRTGWKEKYDEKTKKGLISPH